jgi:hypothetical protein
MLSPEELKAKNERILKEAIDSATRGDDLTPEQYEALIKADLEDEEDQVDPEEELEDSEIDLIDADVEDEEEQGLDNDSANLDLENKEDDNTEDDYEFVLGEKYKEKSDELNRTKQLLDNQKQHEERLKNDPVYASRYFKDLGINVQNDIEDINLDDVDIHDETYLKEVAISKKKIENLEKTIDSLVNNAELSQKQIVAKNKKNEAINQLEQLQRDVPELKLKKDFVKTHEAYKNWYDTVGEKNADRYMTDKGFRQSVDKKGYKCPIDKQDYERITDIYQIFDKYQKEGYNSVKDAYRCSDQFDKILIKRKSATLQDGEALINDKLNELEGQTEILDDTTTLSDFESGKAVNESEQTRILEADPRTLNERDTIIRNNLIAKYCTLD